MEKKQNEENQHWKVLVLLLKMVAESKGLTNVEIARRTGFHANNVGRIFTTKYSPSLKNFMIIAQAVGINFFFEDKESDSDLSVLFEKAMTEMGRRVDTLPKINLKKNEMKKEEIILGIAMQTKKNREFFDKEIKPGQQFGKLHKIADENKGKIYIVSERKYVDKSEC